MRFAFQRGSFLAFRSRDGDPAAIACRRCRWSAALRDPRIMTFVAVWFGINILFGLGSMSLTGEAQSVAWQAHIGGFLAGLLLFRLFDPVGRRAGAITTAFARLFNACGDWCAAADRRALSH